MTNNDRLINFFVKSLRKSIIRTRARKDLIIEDLIDAKACLQAMREIDDDFRIEVYDEINGVITHLQQKMPSLDQETLDSIAAILHKFQAKFSSSTL